MNETEFLALVSLNVETWFQPKEEESSKKKSRYVHTILGWCQRPKKLLNEINMDDIIRTEWTTGGVSGGGYWDESKTDNRYSTSGEPEPEFVELDKLLEKLCPNISYFEYKKLTKGLIEYTDYTIDEYYGNSTSYGVKFIKLRNLFDRLKEAKLI